MRTIGSIDLGDSARLTIRFRDPDTDLPTDPTTVTAEATSPNGGTPVAATVTKSTIGVYRAIWLPDVAGPWRVKIAAVGPAAGVEYGIVRVRPVP
jgi:hypothetical protein